MTTRDEYMDPYDSHDAVDDWSEIHDDSDEPGDPDTPYFPPRVPVGLPHVVRFATESGDLSWKERSIVIMLSRFADPNGRASVAVSTLCKAMRIGSKNTVERALNLAAHPDVRILSKESGKGGNGRARKSNVYTFLGAERSWEPLTQTRPGVPPVVALARAHRTIEEQGALIRELQAELARLRNVHSTGEDFIGHPVTDDGVFIGHNVTNETSQPSPETASHSYENDPSEASQESGGFNGHERVTNENQGNEGQQYLARRNRVEPLVMEFRDHFRSSFRQGGVPSAVHYFSESPDREEELLAQIRTLRADRESSASGERPPDEPERAPPGRRGVEPCPDCDRPFTTYGGAEYCPDCTERRRREGEV